MLLARSIRSTSTSRAPPISASTAHVARDAPPAIGCMALIVAGAPAAELRKAARRAVISSACCVVICCELPLQPRWCGVSSRVTQSHLERSERSRCTSADLAKIGDLKAGYTENIWHATIFLAALPHRQHTLHP